ncbi:TetR family transcriptional regulator [Kribbella antiqua]|uniref:TetR family transcriptional regulator n=1 Tax=Kribbella antiqua TaxID=2512217 RepID=A0A4R2ILC0_9ACTN|nr:TetR/AcrR family transcriptional regulator [Kribbella antiqua]TCO45793.1 TetR family transcriptional regulator [Kribbella antiqua]
MKESIWTRSRAAAPARETLSREQIVQAAIATLDEEGVAGLSMRKLAAKLGAGATSLYWHVQTKDDLIELVIDEVYGEVDVPDPDLAGWRSGALLFGHSLRAAVLRHPWLAEVIYSRPSLGPNAMSLGGRGIALFRAAGFTGRDIDHAMSSVMSYVLGSVSAEAAVRTEARKRGDSVDDWAGEVLEQTRTVIADHPEMRESVERYTGRDMASIYNESFAFGLDTVLEGLEARLRK